MKIRLCSVRMAFASWTDGRLPITSEDHGREGANQMAGLRDSIALAPTGEMSVQLTAKSEKSHSSMRKT